MTAGQAVRTWPLYVGGFLGPFGSPVVTTMLPELSQEFGVTVEAASTSLSAYLFPFAALMIFSGTLAERFGRKRTVQVGYIVYCLASIGCALAPSFELFMLARMVQGAANAFTTPVLVAAISDVVPPERLGGALGLFGSLQATGQAMAPLAGGLAATFDWRAAFWFTALVSLVLATQPPEDSRHKFTGRQVDRWKVLANRQLLLACVVAALGFLTTMGLVLVAALAMREDFGLQSTLAGLVVALFGLAGLATGRWSGSLMDRYGRLRVGSINLLVLGVASMLVGLSLGLPFALGLIVAILSIVVAGVAGTATRAVGQFLAVTSAPTNRAGATSVMLAFQFSGAALAPLIWVPVFQGGQHIGALVWAGIPAILAGILLLIVQRTGWIKQPKAV